MIQAQTINNIETLPNWDQENIRQDNAKSSHNRNEIVSANKSISTGKLSLQRPLQESNFTNNTTGTTNIREIKVIEDDVKINIGSDLVNPSGNHFKSLFENYFLKSSTKPIDQLKLFHSSSSFIWEHLNFIEDLIQSEQPTESLNQLQLCYTHLRFMQSPDFKFSKSETQISTGSLLRGFTLTNELYQNDLSFKKYLLTYYKLVLKLSCVLIDINKLSLQEFSKLINRNSNIFTSLVSLLSSNAIAKNMKSKFTIELSNIFYQLSQKTKTILKLNFLFSAMIFMSLENLNEDLSNDNRKLINETVETFTIMITKNPKVVNDYSSESFKCLLNTWKLNHKNVNELKVFINLFNKNKLSQPKRVSPQTTKLKNHSDVIRSDLKSIRTNNQEPKVNNNSTTDTTNVNNIESALRNLSIKTATGSEVIEKLNQLIENHKEQNNNIFYKNLIFIKIRSLLVDMNLNDSRNQQFLINFLKIWKNQFNSFQFEQTHYDIFDLITIKLKNFDQFKDNFNFHNDLIEIIFQIILKFNNPDIENIETTEIIIKKLRNFSNLLFQLGNLNFNLNFEQSFSNWLLSIDMEIENLKFENTLNNFKIFKMKIERILNKLIENSKFNETFNFFSKVFENYENLTDLININYLNYESKFESDLSSIIKLLTKIIIKNNTIIKLNKFSITDKSKAVITISLLKLITKLNYKYKVEITNKSILQLKNELNDNGLFIYCLSKISFIIENNLTFKSLDQIMIEPNSSVGYLNTLIKSHINLLQCITSLESNDTNNNASTERESFLQTLNNSIALIENWIAETDENEKLFPYHFDIIQSFVKFISFNGLFSKSRYLLKLSLEKFQNSQTNIDSKNYFNDLVLKLCDIESQMTFSNTLTQTLSSYKPSGSSDMVRHLIYSVSNKIYLDKFEEGFEQCSLIVKTINSNPEELSLSQISQRSRAVELLTLFADFSYSYGSLLLHVSQDIESILAFKTAVRIYQSILKNFFGTNAASIGFSLSSKFLVKFELNVKLCNSLKMLIELTRKDSLFKDFEYYLNELKVLTGLQKSPLVRSYNYKYIISQEIYSNTLSVNSKSILDEIFEYDAKHYAKYTNFNDLSSDLNSIEFYYLLMQYGGKGDLNLNDEYYQNIDNFRNKIESSILSDLPKLNSISERIEDNYISCIDISDLRDIFRRLLNIQLIRQNLKLNGKLSENKFSEEIINTLGLQNDTWNLISSKKLAANFINENDLGGLTNMPQIISKSDMSLIKNVGKQDEVNAFLDSIECSISNVIPLLLRKYQFHEVSEFLQISKYSYFLNNGIVSKSLKEQNITSGEDNTELWLKLVHSEDVVKQKYFKTDSMLSNAIEIPSKLVPQLDDITACSKVSKISENTNLLDEFISDALAMKNKLGHSLPLNWMVITLNICSLNGDLLINKITRDKSAQNDVSILSFRLPLDSIERRKRRNEDDEDIAEKNENLSFDSVYKRLQDIIKSSDETTQIARIQRIKTKQDKAEWWRERKSLDNDLKTVLEDIDHYWFGGFRTLFESSKFQETIIKDFKREVYEIMNQLVSETEYSKIDDTSIELLLLQDPTVQENKTLSFKLAKDIIMHMLYCIQSKMPSFKMPISSEIDGTVGKVVELLERRSTILKESDDTHIVLIPTHQCNSIPWESTPILRNKSVTRMPSIQMLTDLLNNNNDLPEGKQIDTSKGYYVINPAGDLKRTEENFKTIFEDMHGWNGIVGDKPTETDIIQGISNSNLYIYAGHGGGEQYIKSKSIKKLENCCPTILLGCSSGALKYEGVFEPYGTVYNYLLGGSPMVLANLWDVTDKDIDKFTISMFQKWELFVDYDSLKSFSLSTCNDDSTENNELPLNLSEAIRDSRDTCTLKYLNGAAPILYGIPMTLK